MKILFLTLGFVAVLFQSAVAKSNVTVNSVIKSSFTNVSAIESKQLILTKKQFSQIQKRAKAPVTTKIYRYYAIKSGSIEARAGKSRCRKFCRCLRKSHFAFHL